MNDRTRDDYEGDFGDAPDTGRDLAGDIAHDDMLNDGVDDDFTGDAELGSSYDTSADVQCPYCGETCEIELDPAGGSVQQYVEDCQVCCQPWTVVVTFHATGQADVYLERADG